MPDAEGRERTLGAAYRAVARAVSEDLSLTCIYERCHRVIESIMPAPNMFVSVAEPDGLRFPYYTDQYDPESPLDLYPREGLTGTILNGGKPVWLRKTGLPEGTRTIGRIPVDLIAFPIPSPDGQTIGAIIVQTYDAAEGYCRQDVDFIEYVATQLSMAIRLADMERQLAIVRIANLVEETVDEADLYPKIQAVIRRIIRPAAKNLLIARVDEAAGVFRSVFVRDEHGWNVPETWPLDFGLSGYLYSERKRSYIYQRGRTELPPDANLPDNDAPAFWLGVPIVWASRIIGVLVIQSYDMADPLTVEDEHALNGMAPYLASTIGKTEFYSRMRNP